MLKLIKYEMIHSYRSFILVFGLFLTACILIPLLPYDISAIGMGLLMMAVFGIAISVFVTIVRNYNTSMFKKPGYLTLTLPVSTHKLLLSKIISALIWTAISSAILGIGMLCLVLIIVNRTGLEMSIFTLFDEFLELLKYIEWDIVGQLFAQFIVGGILSIVGVFTLLTVLQTKYTRKHKTVIGFVIYIAYIFVMSIFNQILYPNTLVGMELGSYMWVTMLVNCLLIIGFYFLTVYVLDHKIEIE